MDLRTVLDPEPVPGRITKSFMINLWKISMAMIMTIVFAYAIYLAREASK
jgi:hypothetical protein